MRGLTAPTPGRRRAPLIRRGKAAHAGAWLGALPWLDPATALAHPLPGDGAPASSHGWSLTWTFTPWVVGLLCVAAIAYVAGVFALWHHAGRAKGVSRRQAAAFALGWLALVAALVSPLDALSSQLFSAHMLQHELLMVVAAPLLVLGRPLAVFAWALPPLVRRRVVAGVRVPWLLGIWRTLTWAPNAWALHGIALWAWHLPAAFDAALGSSGWHTLQHTSFFATALLFWWEPLGGAARSRPGPALLYLFTTMLHTAALGALLTLSPALWYAPYGSTSAQLGIDALEDQQLGGLVMWVPSGIAYFATALAVVARLLRPAGLHSRAGFRRDP